MKTLSLIVLLAVLPLAGFAENVRDAAVHEKVTVREIAALKTIAAAEAFASSHKMPFSKMSVDQMRARKVQIPTHAAGAVGRLQTVLWLDGAEAVAYVDFYHDEGGHVLSTYIHVEPQNE